MLFEDSYKTIVRNSAGEFRDRGSRFIALAYPLSSEKDVKSILLQVKKEHPQANHHCYAFRLSPDTSVFRFSDDREPSGSAGRPILNAILSSGLTNILIIVVRYFGGTLLGVPGLINAYREAAALSLTNAEITEKTINENFSICCSYDLLKEVYQLIRITGAEITSQETDEVCRIFLSIRKSKAAEFEKQFKTNHLLQSAAKLESIV